MKNILLWVLAFVITIGAAYYQRTTGPTYPVRTTVTIDGTGYELSLRRSQTNTRPCTIEMAVPEDISGVICYRRYRSDDEWTIIPMERKEGFIAGLLPSQPAAGKLEYYLILESRTGEKVTVREDKPVIIRFKGDVPAAIMIPHILIMFAAMLLSTLAGLFALSGDVRHRRYGVLTLILLVTGGMILGPLVQYYAFGELWTGIPFGWDLTDNKTLFAIVAWVAAVLVNRRKESRAWTIIAAIVLLLIYSIPHSLFGSELDYASGQVTQGFILLLSGL